MAGRQIVLEPYNPAWPAQFAEEEKRVREVLGDVALAVHHIGSTSVPGLADKICGRARQRFSVRRLQRTEKRVYRAG